mmetsp:Transcript_11963/g.17554  ORF Transcript_11963/g.17554 Transcript_11963/m.17554 type:complete len:545 (+) Transcript_11963:51-1685(+)
MQSWAILLILCSASLVLADLQCTYFAGILREQVNNEVREEITHLCRLGNGQKYTLPYQLSQELSDVLISGSSRLECVGMEIDEENDEIRVVSDEPLIHVLPDKKSSIYRFIDDSPTNVERSVLVVRIKSSDGRREPSYTKERLNEVIFSDSRNVNSFAFQYKKCSNGKLRFVPGTLEEPMGVPGVVDMVISENFDNLHFDRAMERRVNDLFAKEIAPMNSYDHIIFCLPRNMENKFLAFAIKNDNVSYYADPWCGKLSGTMHEIGHNLGLSHSGEWGNQEYDDESDSMGLGYNRFHGPKKCFNGQKFWYFDWFPNQKVSITSEMLPWSGSLGAFVDVDLDEDIPVVLRVGKLYLVYNRKSKHNREVNEKADMVTVVTADSPSSTSWMLAGLSSRSGSSSTFETTTEFAGEVLTITLEVCQMVNGNVDTSDYAEMVIRTSDQELACPSTSPSLAPLAPSPIPQTAPETEPPIFKTSPLSCVPNGSVCGTDDDCCLPTSRCSDEYTSVCEPEANVVGGTMFSVSSGGGRGGMQRLRSNGRKLGRFR